MQNNAAIVILSYPDTIVRPAYNEFSSKIWPLIGVGGKHAVQAGHAALLLIAKEIAEILYFDFGRYITTNGFGRVRSKETDVELAIPLIARFKEDKIENLEEILLWLEAHPEKTHGEGRLVASVNYEIDFTKALDYIRSLQEQKEVAYGAFIKGGSNCARFVTDTVIHSTTNKKVKRKLKTSNLFTPSPVGNAIKGNTDAKIYQLFHQKLKPYSNTSVLKEYAQCFAKRIPQEPNLIGTELPDENTFSLQNATWLGGIGSGAWFQLSLENNQYKVRRFNSIGQQDFEGVFNCSCNRFDISKPYEIIYPTNCDEVFIKQSGELYTFTRSDNFL